MTSAARTCACGMKTHSVAARARREAPSRRPITTSCAAARTKPLASSTLATHQLSELRLHMRGRSAADGFGDVTGKAGHKAQLHRAADRGLQQGVAGSTPEDVIRCLDVAVDKYPLPGHQHVIKHRQGIFLV